ncbi:MAG: hypothetical protein DWQ10_10850 [Calditrichaeota bacterium]|nr:MAG: hypothetical protein DWQ10_10850 [Calditrichota bacterium]
MVRGAEKYSVLILNFANSVRSLISELPMLNYSPENESSDEYGDENNQHTLRRMMNVRKFLQRLQRMQYENGHRKRLIIVHRDDNQA